MRSRYEKRAEEIGGGAGRRGSRGAEGGEDAFDGEGAAGDVGGVFEEQGVARHESGRGGAEELPERIIPRHDGEDDAEGLEDDGGVYRGADGVDGTEEMRGVLGVEIATQGAFIDLGEGVGARFAHLGGDDAGEGGALAAEGGGDGAEVAGAGGEGCVAPGEEGGVGGGESGGDLRGGVGAVALDEAAGGGVVGDERHGDGGAEFFNAKNAKKTCLRGRGGHKKHKRHKKRGVVLSRLEACATFRTEGFLSSKGCGRLGK